MVAIEPETLGVVETVEEPAQSGRGTGRWLRAVGPSVAVFVVLIGVWYAITYLALDKDTRYLMPPPNQVVTQFFNGQTAGEIFSALGLSAEVAVIGLVISIVIGMTWAVLMSQAKWVETALFPYAVFLQCIPILALVPLIGFWFGFDLPARVIVSVMIALFPIVANTLFGLQSVERAQRELFRLQGASRWTILTKLQFPTAAPAIFAGLRISAGLSVIGALVGDFFFQQGTPGLGALINQYEQTVESPQLFAAIVVASLFGVLVFLFFGLIARLAIGRWYDFD
jgi:NitT/TauT family transport system permease protein